ncbi:MULTISPECIES: transposase [unclassified Rhodococcus (in: high G+C Gram-positive bacteria)]|uniref:transposase n=1 Tax=unclassified Rhodococcus (in: high G+C Gram-positive bacteria) TaxID=192944 RepID=UPI00339B93C4
MSRKRRSFTTEYKVDGARRVIDSGRTIAEVARELGINEALLGRWVADERRRIEAAAVSGDRPLTAAERTELARLRRQVSGQSHLSVPLLRPDARSLFGVVGCIVISDGTSTRSSGSGELWLS